MSSTLPLPPTTTTVHLVTLSSSLQRLRSTLPLHLVDCTTTRLHSSTLPLPTASSTLPRLLVTSTLDRLILLLRATLLIVQRQPTTSSTHTSTLHLIGTANSLTLPRLQPHRLYHSLHLFTLQRLPPRRPMANLYHVVPRLLSTTSYRGYSLPPRRTTAPTLSTLPRLPIPSPIVRRLPTTLSSLLRPHSTCRLVPRLPPRRLNHHYDLVDPTMTTTLSTQPRTPLVHPTTATLYRLVVSRLPPCRLNQSRARAARHIAAAGPGRAHDTSYDPHASVLHATAPPRRNRHLCRCRESSQRP